MEGKTNNNSGVPFNKQFTVRAVIIGCLGCAILSMSSMYVALRLGSSPFPIIFVSLVSMFALKLAGNTNLNEINVTHTIMSAGSLTAVGLAFTLPGIYMLNPEAEVDIIKLLLVVLFAVILGMIFTAVIREYFVVKQGLPFAMGMAGAATVKAGDVGGKKTTTLFVSLLGSGIFTTLRDGVALFPATFFSKTMMSYGSYGGVWFSPMLMGIGYIVGPILCIVWFLGGCIGDLGILIGGVKFGLWNSATASAIKSSLGIGIMLGCGIGIIVKGILPKAKEIFGPMFDKKQMGTCFIPLNWVPICLAAIVLVLTVVCDVGVVASIILILGVWLTTSMSAQAVGQTGVNPCEVFGMLVMIAAKAFSPSLGETGTFFIAIAATIASAMVGDVMNDFKSGYILHTDPKAQWIGECIGGVLGAFVSVAVFYVILKAYGASSFGNPEMFVAPQAAAVVSMVGGIPHVPAFVIGLVIGFALYCLNLPIMTLGLGVYVPFYLSITVLIGGIIALIVKKYFKQWQDSEQDMAVAAGVLGGESVVGVVIALVQSMKFIIG